MIHKFNTPSRKWSRYSLGAFLTKYGTFSVTLTDCTFDEAIERIPTQKALIALIDDLSKR